MMQTFAIVTLGCKVNQYESQQIREFLEHLGLRCAQPPAHPDLIIVNTCCVTHTASAKSRQYIRRSQRLNPDAVLLVCGCLPSAQIGELHPLAENIHVIANRDELPSQLYRIIASHTSISQSKARRLTRIETQFAPNINQAKHLSARLQPASTGPAAQFPPGPRPTTGGFNNPPHLPAVHPQHLPTLNAFKGHTRAFLKIQDGCDGRCTYCIVPRARPIVRSKPPELVVQEARALVAAGHREIVLTGVFLGAYGQLSVRRENWPDRRSDRLAELLDVLAEIPNLARIRLSSLEPADVTERLLEAFCRHPNIMPHLHLSLQSGSDAILRRMCRQYTADEFRASVELIKARLDRPAITTDIIVGFPGETDADFERTAKMAEDVGFLKMHIFAFSPREGTAAAKMKDAVARAVVKERTRVLQQLSAELGRRYREQFVGESAEVLVEDNNGTARGRSERYFMVCIDGVQGKLRRNELQVVRLVANREDGMAGRLC